VAEGYACRARDSESAAVVHARSTFRPTIGEGLVLVDRDTSRRAAIGPTRDLPSQVSLACIIARIQSHVPRRGDSERAGAADRLPRPRTARHNSAEAATIGVPGRSLRLLADVSGLAASVSVGPIEGSVLPDGVTRLACQFVVSPPSNRGPDSSSARTAETRSDREPQVRSGSCSIQTSTTS
jgi:hypothetical protein